MENSIDSLPQDIETVPASVPAKEEIVKINLPVFEGFLNEIKDQLVKHEKQLESPAWLDDLKAESDKIAGLARRLEHTQLDVNSIKDFIYYPPTNGPKEKQRKDPMLLLQADVESLKLVARRIDLYQSEDLNVYMQLKKLQKDYYDLLKMIEKLDKDSVINAMKIDFNNKISDMQTRIGDIGSIVEENQINLNDKIDEVQAVVEMEMTDKIKEVQDQINAFLSDGEDEEEGGVEIEGGIDEDPTEGEDTFHMDTVESASILKPSQMRTPSPPSSTRKTLLSSPNNNTNTVSSSSAGTINETTVTPTKRSTRITLPENSSNNVSSEVDDINNSSNGRNTISNATPGIMSKQFSAPVSNLSIPASPAAANTPNKRASTFLKSSKNNSPTRDTTLSTMGRGTSRMSTASAAGGPRKTTTKGGKFCTLERFHGLQDEVEQLKFALTHNIYKLRAHGVSRMQKVFAHVLGRDALFFRKKAFAKLKLNMHYVKEEIQSKYRTLSIKVDTIVERASGKQKIKNYFERWQWQVERMQQGQKLFWYSHGIMTYWHERVKINLKKYLNIWKNFTVESFRKFIYVGLEESEAPAYDEFQHLLNGNFNMKAMRKIARKDLMRRMSIREAKQAQNTPQVAYVKDVEAEEKLNATIEELTKRLEESEEESKVLRRDVLRLYALFEGQKQDITARVDKESTAIIGSINNFKSKVTTQLTHTADLIELNQKRCDTNFSLHADISEALKARINATDRELDFHKETQHSIISSQKSIRVEMDELLVKQEYIDNKFKQVSNEIMLNSRAMSVGIEEVRRVEKEYKDITSYYDSEINAIKSNASTIESNLNQQIQHTEEVTKMLEIKSDLLAANQDEVFPQKPQAYFCYKICQSYEKVMLRIHNEGGVNLLNKSIEEELHKISTDMAIEATRIAHYVVTAADRNVSHRLMETLVLQTASPANLELDNKPSNQHITHAMQFSALSANNGVHNNHNMNVKNIPIAVQVTQEREALLNDFLNQFVNIMKDKDPQPGFVKANARIVFHAKLKLTTEVLISKSNCMYNLLDNPSLLTKKQYTDNSPVLGATLTETLNGEACLTCNRPISATVERTSRPPSVVNRPPSASRSPLIVNESANNNNNSSNNETAASIAQLQQQLARVTTAMNKLKLLDNSEVPLRLTNSTTGILRPHSANVKGSNSMTPSTSSSSININASNNNITINSNVSSSNNNNISQSNNSSSNTISIAAVESPQRLKRVGTAHNKFDFGTSDGPESDDLIMVDREHHTHLNTRRNSNSNVNFSQLLETDFEIDYGEVNEVKHNNSEITPPRLKSSLSQSGSRSPSPPFGTSHHQTTEPEFDYDGFHQYLDKPAAAKKTMPTSSGAVRHRDAVHKSHAMLLTTQGGGFKISPAMSQEDMINQLTASFHADVSIPRDVNDDRSDLLYTEDENMLREIERHALDNEVGLRSALMTNYPGTRDVSGHHSPSGMILSQSDSHLLGSRRLVANNSSKGKKPANSSTIAFN